MLKIKESKTFIKHIAVYMLVSVLLELVIESLNRKSLLAGVEYMAGSPLLFCFNSLIILFTLSFAMFFINFIIYINFIIIKNIFILIL